MVSEGSRIIKNNVVQSFRGPLHFYLRGEGKLTVRNEK